VALDLNLDTTTPTGRLVASVMAAVAQWERETIGMRTSEGLAVARASGVRLGQPVLIPAEIEQRIVAERLGVEPWPLSQRPSTTTSCPCLAAGRSGTRRRSVAS
jgi:hypothetical protein